MPRTFVSVIAWFAALAGLVVISTFAAAHDTFKGDVWLSQRIQELDSAALARVLDWMEDLTDFPLLVGVYLAGAAGLLVVAGRLSAMLLLLSASGRLVNSGLKEIVERPRPSPQLLDFSDQPSSFSFPSGHVEGAVVLYGLIFYFATAYLDDARLRLPLQAACILIVVITSFERVHAGHHWPSDILGGYYVGFLVLAAFIYLHRLVIARRKA